MRVGPVGACGLKAIKKILELTWLVYTHSKVTTAGFLSQRPVTQRFDVFIDMRLNKRSVWRHCNVAWSVIKHEKQIWLVGDYCTKCMQFQAKRNHSFGKYNIFQLKSFLFADGVMWNMNDHYWGWSQPDHATRDGTVFRRVPIPEPVLAVTSGFSHCLAMARDKVRYAR